MVTFGKRIGGSTQFGPTWIVLWVHGNLKFERGLRIHECEFLYYKLQTLRLQLSTLLQRMVQSHRLLLCKFQGWTIEAVYRHSFVEVIAIELFLYAHFICA